MKSTILRSLTYSIVSYIQLVSDYYSIFIVIFKLTGLVIKIA